MESSPVRWIPLLIFWRLLYPLDMSGAKAKPALQNSAEITASGGKKAITQKSVINILFSFY